MYIFITIYFSANSKSSSLIKMNRSVKTSTVGQQASNFNPLPGLKKAFPHIKPVVDCRISVKFLKKATPIRPSSSNVVATPKWNITTEVDRNIRPLPGKKETLETLRKPFRARPMPNFNKATNPSVPVINVEKKANMDLSWLGVALLPVEENYRLEDELQPAFEEIIEENIPTCRNQATKRVHHHNSSAMAACFNWTKSPVNNIGSGKRVVGGLGVKTSIRAAIRK